MEGMTKAVRVSSSAGLAGSDSGLVGPKKVEIGVESRYVSCGERDELCFSFPFEVSGGEILLMAFINR
jgi:hypothetical protein